MQVRRNKPACCRVNEINACWLIPEPGCPRFHRLAAETDGSTFGGRAQLDRLEGTAIDSIFCRRGHISHLVSARVPRASEFAGELRLLLQRQSGGTGGTGVDQLNGMDALRLAAVLEEDQTRLGQGAVSFS